MAFIIDNGGGYNSTATSLNVLSDADIFIGQIYETDNGERIIVTNKGATVTVARGMDATSGDTIADGETLTEVSPVDTESDDLTSGVNWTVENDAGGSVSFGVGGATATLDFNKALALYYNVQTHADWTTLRIECHYTKDGTSGLRFGITTNDPPEGHLLEYDAGRDTAGYNVNKDGTYTYIDDRSDASPVANSNPLTAPGAADIIKCIISKTGDGKVRFFSFVKDTKGDTGADVDDPIAHTGAMLVGLGLLSYVAADNPIITDFVLEVFRVAGGGGGNDLTGQLTADPTSELTAPL